MTNQTHSSFGHPPSFQGLIGALQQIQATHGFLSAESLRLAARDSGRTLADVYGVATFYNSFTLKARGKHVCCVCTGTACHVRGADAIAEPFRKYLGVEEGGTSSNGEFTFETVKCLGACAQGPVVVIDGRHHGRVCPASVTQIVDGVRKGQSSGSVRQGRGDRSLASTRSGNPPADLVRAVVFASRYGIDLLTVDGAGGGTGMSPWRMMNEWGVPPVELHSLLYASAKRLHDQGRVVPALAVAGGFALEDQIYKGLALGAPFVKLVGMARSPLAAAMVGKTIGRAIKDDHLPVYIQRFGSTPDDIFVTAAALKKELGDAHFEKIPPAALGVYTYFERLAQRLRQLMAGSRKFEVSRIGREDLAALTREASDVSGIPCVMDTDRAEIETLLAG